jgi:hypothetical protein
VRWGTERISFWAVRLCLVLVKYGERGWINQFLSMAAQHARCWACAIENGLEENILGRELCL